MTKKLIQIRQNRRVMQLTWIMNNICTNHCDYCPPDLHMGKNHHYEWKNVKSFIDRLVSHYSSIHCSISGGEPTVSPFFPELVSTFYDAGHTVGITTNGSRNVRYWREIAPKLSYICFSYHPAYPDAQLLDKIREAALHTSCVVRVMMDSRYWDQAMEFYKQCIKLPYIGVEPVRILPEIAARRIGDDYTDEQNNWLNTTKQRSALTSVIHETNPAWRPANAHSTFYYDDGSFDSNGDSNYLISTGQNDFRGWACNIGLESLFIHYNGWVKKGNCYQSEELFHIDSHEEHELPISAELCVQKICHCNTDVLISKVPVIDKDHNIIKSRTFQKKLLNEEEYKIIIDSFTPITKKNKT